jgi:putative pyruvate formate lyase activating enzyme
MSGLKRGEMQDEIDSAEYQHCRLCPRSCGIDRTKQLGFCRESAELSVAAHLCHHGEEPPISFERGSGTIFFTGCSLRCSFCQNRQISQTPEHREYCSPDQLINMMMDLIDQGAENINFVTPDHFLPHIVAAVKELRKRSRSVPFVYNCSGYQSLRNLQTAVKYIDIFLFDYKFADPEAAEYCSQTRDYPEVAEAALAFIYEQCGNLQLDARGKALRGVIVRHLIMPNFADNSIAVIDRLHARYGADLFLSLMSQYSPRYLRPGLDLISRRVSGAEYNRVVERVEALGWNNCYVQDFISEDDGYLPDFRESEVFSAQKGRP